ncbi:TlpA family protein disulfide reductase [Allochromatium vinosum]|uniref:Alkyl hydroperoxide reductase/ Thiol specific antioxidant/ Mal allergen n=1 Tax=Allochromatium vinosum (strain ATCC 17899 / DSM 180 / NBRC 103801 / NCIMB 10441 / D) TaxID=572477 RepID=D3RUH4_ALLVD|nr:TlpA disulfide reductase family protein [Allochromatium vinosum]ADC62833.1 alkyl hydroperoxide reductase/ Thiol specific antioxidant/ Mal allergen [Allochromatium vinosum DSM 180]
MKALKVILVTALAGGISIGTAIIGQRWVEFENADSGRDTERFELQAESLQTLPDFRLTDLEGREVASNAWAGKVLVLNFWATWCPPCLSEIPRFVEIQERLRESGVQFVGIAVDQVEDVRAFVAEQPVNYPLLIATPEVLKFSVQLGNRLEVLPFTVIFDRHGRRVHGQIGELSAEELAELLNPLLVREGPRVSRTP